MKMPCSHEKWQKILHCLTECEVEYTDVSAQFTDDTNSHEVFFGFQPNDTDDGFELVICLPGD